MSDILRLKDFPQVSHVNGMSFVCAVTQKAFKLKTILLEDPAWKRQLSQAWHASSRAPEGKSTATLERIWWEDCIFQLGDAEDMLYLVSTR